MPKGQVRILYNGEPDAAKDELFKEFMEGLGYQRFSVGHRLGERELCFLPPESGLQEFYAQFVEEKVTEDD